MRRFRVSSSLSLALVAMCGVAEAQSSRQAPVYHDSKQLGGETSFYLQRPLTDANSLRQMAETRGMENDIRRVLNQARLRDPQVVAADVVRVMRGGFSSERRGGSCDTEVAREGELVTCSFPVGGTLPWMAYRPGSGGGVRPAGIVRNFRWAGDAPFEAFLFRAYSRGTTYTIIIPKPCGNLSVTDTRPDLRVTKLAQQGRFEPGGPIGFTISVVNAAPNGAMAATNVRLTDTLPSGGGLAWAPVTTGSDVCTVSGGTLTCNFGTLAPVESRTVTVVSTTPTPFDACREQQNTARVSADNALPAEGSATSACVPPQVRLTKTTQPFVVGAPVTFTMTVSNLAAAGASAARRVLLDDTLPTDGGLEWATVTPNTCRLSGAGNATMQCEIGTLAAGASTTVTVTSRPAPVAACVAQNNRARVTSDGTQTTEAAATASCTPAQLTIEKTPDNGSFKQGQQAAFSIVVRNPAPAGASPATNVTVTDTLPTNGGLSWTTATASAGSCELTGAARNALSCNLGTIAAGQSVTISLASPAKTPRSACQAQPNPEAVVNADGGLTARDGGSLTCDPSFNFFADAFIGKDRRVRPVEGRERIDGAAVIPNVGLAGLEFAQCSPLLGLNMGLAKQLRNNWELAGTAGLAASLVQADDKVRQHQVTLDVEANKYLNRRGGAFIGTGLSMWDLFHTDTITPSALVHFGLPIGNHPVHQTHFVGEGRLFLRNADDVPNNYQFWGGLRVNF